MPFVIAAVYTIPLFSFIIRNYSNEKNFHIFYYLCDGLSAENKLADYFLDTGKRAHRYATLPPLTSMERQVHIMDA